MRKIAIERLVPGMVTARQVFAPGEHTGLPLLAAHVTLTEAVVARLESAGVTTVMIDDEYSAGIEAQPPINDALRKAAITAVHDTVDTLRKPDGMLTPHQIESIAHTINAIVDEIANRPNLLVCLSDLNTFGGERFEHAVKVCVVGCAIATQLYSEYGWTDFRGNRRGDQVPDRLQKLGLGLLLMDVGSLAIPEAIWSRRYNVSGEDKALIEQHPLVGVELLRSTDLSPLATVTIAQHHERFDGTGYPKRLRGDQIHDHAQIAGIAEEYVRLCDPRALGGEECEPHEAYRRVITTGVGPFSQRVVETFAHSIAPYGPTATVQLADGRYGIVVSNTTDPLRPIIRITHDRDGMLFTPYFDLDLSKEPDARIAGSTSGLPTDA